MAIAQKLTLDVNQPNIFYYINAKQGDSGRILNIRITVDGIPYNIPSSSTIKFRAIKPNDTVIYDNGVVNSDGTCSITLTAATLAVIGKIYADISVIYGGTTVSSVSFVIINHEVPGDKIGIMSTNEYPQINTFVGTASQYDSTLINKAIGIGLTASLSEDILTIVKNY